MRALNFGVRTDDGRLLSREREITYEGVPVHELCVLRLVSDNDPQEEIEQAMTSWRKAQP